MINTFVRNMFLLSPTRCGLDRSVFCWLSAKIQLKYGAFAARSAVQRFVVKVGQNPILKRQIT
jgi:hypothetical protein